MKKVKQIIPLLLILLLGGYLADLPAKFKSVARPWQEDEANPTEELYNQRCAGCHGFDGNKERPNTPDFTDPEFQRKHTDAEFIEAITEGIRPRMPAYKSSLSKEQIKSLVAYVRAFAKKE
ncbi:MAG: cytochrome c [Acidobacteriota bacterium]